MIIIREGNADQTERHEMVKRSEVWSTKIMMFNKTSDRLSFVSSEWMKGFAAANNMDIKVRQCDRNSSQTIYILTHKCQ